MSKMQVAFVAGPYRDQRGAFYIGDNIANARRIAAELWEMGFAVICPHLHTAHFNGLVDDQTFMDGLIEILLRCDVVVLLRDHEESEGTQAEIAAAKRAGIPVRYLDELEDELR
jgi:nucleoside 2-deoxyribosyltransferase